jgi:hypothetical protein
MFPDTVIYRDCLGQYFREGYSGELIECESDDANFNFSNEIEVNPLIAQLLTTKKTLHEIVATCKCPIHGKRKVKMQMFGTHFSDVCIQCFPKVVVAKPELFKDCRFKPAYLQHIQPHSSKPVYKPTKYCRTCSKGDCGGTLAEECRKWARREAPLYIRVRADFIAELIELLNNLQSKEKTV